MGKLHIKRINAPKTWPIKRKESKWVTRPKPGSQILKRTISINTIFKEMLNKVGTLKEVKAILNKELVKVNGVVRKKPDFPVCVLDVITIKDENYRLLINPKGKLFMHPVKKEDAQIKLRKIIGKKVLKGNKLQINFQDGNNLISKDTKLKVLDTLVYNGKEQKDHLKLEEGSIIYLLDGKQVGKMGVIKQIIPRKGVQLARITFKTGKEEFETLREFAFVIGKTKPLIDIPNE